MKVLLIDDNKEITDAISDFLQDQNISCTICNSGKEGLDTIRKEKFNLILLDIAMPEFSGLDIVETLFREMLLEKNNIVIATASTLDDAKIEFLVKRGVKQVIKKPLSLDNLQQIIDKVR